MKYFLLILLILCGFYLNRSYAYFYNYFDKNFLEAPNETLNPKSQKPNFITLGDSLLDGVGASSEQTSFSYMLYKSSDPKSNMNLINLAVSGAKVRNVLEEQLPVALQEDLADVVILIGINDIHDQTPLKSFEKDYRGIIEELTSKTSAKITLINIPYLGSDLILLPPWNFYTDLKTRQYNEIIKNLAEEKNLKLVDLYGLTEDKFKKNSSLYSKDQFHPSDQGYALWMELINNTQNSNAN